MAEPGTPAPDLAALDARARQIEHLIASRTNKVMKLLTHIERVIQPQTTGPRSSTRLAAHGKPRRKDVDGPPPWIASALSEAREEMAALGALAKDIITALSQVPEESPHADYNVLGQGRKDPGREDMRQGGMPAGTSERGSHEQAVPASAKSHAVSKPSTQTIAATSPEVISDAAQQPQVQPADNHDEGTRSPSPQDSSTAEQDGNAVAQGASTHERRYAVDQAPAKAHGDNSATSIEAAGDPSSDGSNKDGDKDTSRRDREQVSPPPGDAAASVTSASRSALRQATAADGQHDIPEADRQTKSGGGGDQHATTCEQEHEPEDGDADTVMTDGDQAIGSEGRAGGASTTATTRRPDENDSIRPVPKPDKPDSHAGDSRPSINGVDPADEPGSPQCASGQTTANDRGDIPATNRTPGAEAEAGVPEDEDVVMGDSGATQREGNIGSTAADRRSARFSAPEDDAGRGPVDRGSPSGGGDRTETNQQRQPTTANPTGQDASAQVGTQSPSNDATPEDKAMQPPTTPNSRGSDTTENTSRVNTPNTPHTSPDSPPMTRLSSADIGSMRITALGKATEQEAARTFSVPLVDIDLPRLQSSVNMRALYTTTVRYEHAPEGKGYVRVIPSRDKPHFDWSAFSMVIKRPTIEEARDIIENAIQNPPSGDISYLMGHSPALDRCFEPLVPGPAILENPGLRDLHSQYHHIGNHLSANRFHWEDMTSNPATGFFSGFRSYNEVYFGPGFKLWYAIAMHHTEKFNDLIRKVSKCNDCNQAIGHQNLLVAPTTLDKEGIEYEIDVVGRGQARRTQPGEIHSILNYGACAARSINDMSPEDKLVIETLKYCSKCGLGGAYEKYGAQLVAPPVPLPSARTPLVSEAPKITLKTLKTPKRPAQQQTDTRGRTRACTEKNKKLEKQIDAAKKADPLCSIPTMDLYNPPPLQTEVLVRAASIRSKVALDQLIVLTREHTQLCSSLPEPEDSIDRQIIALKQRVSESALSNFRVRLAQVCLARVVDDEKESLGRRCADHSELEARAERYGVDNIHSHLQQGRKWIKICGPHKGLLPLILLYPLSKTFKLNTQSWKELVQVYNREKLEAFHILLDDPLTQGLDAAGRIFLGILDGGQKAVGWELALSDAEQAEDLASAIKSYRRLSQT